MIKSLLILASGLLISGTASAQEYGVLVGLHQTTADTDVSGYSTSGGFNFKLGLAAAFGLNDQAKFRTGLQYNQRHFELKDDVGGKAEINFSYLDIPALVQFGINEMFSLYGGIVAAVNVGHTGKTTGATLTFNEYKSLIPLIQVGANLMFDDMIGFDLYYERGLGEFNPKLKDFSTFGANFIYWF